jgi:hypothetical protein
MIEIKKNEVGRACNKLVRNERCGLLSGNLKERGNLENIDMEVSLDTGPHFPEVACLMGPHKLEDILDSIVHHSIDRLCGLVVRVSGC